jgi:hydrogenase expression/formation protein HypC
MCLAVPGRIVSIDPGAAEFERSAQVDFGGLVKAVNLAYVPQACIGDYVLVHVGFAISTLDAAEAGRVFEYLREIDALETP